MAAGGVDASESYMRKMLEHHRGAVAMSDVALQNGVSGALRQQVEKTRAENLEEAKLVENMLSGMSHQEASSALGAPSAVEAKAQPAPAKTKDGSAPTGAMAFRNPPPRQSLPPTAKPSGEASPAKVDCLPEHRAAGHC